MFLDRARRAGARAQPVGPLASGVPGIGGRPGAGATPLRHGCTLAEVMAPAIALARDGFDVSWALADSLQRAQTCSRSSPRRSARSTSAPTARCRSRRSSGATRSRPHAQRSSPSDGPDAFYKGAIADLIAAEMAAVRRVHHEGRPVGLSAPRERPPVIGHVSRLSRRLDAAPSSGGVALLRIAEHPRALPLSDYGRTTRRARCT